MRKLFSGLVRIVEQALGRQVEAGGVVSVLQSSAQLGEGVIFFAVDGLAMFYRRLESGTFELPQAAVAANAAGKSVAGVEIPRSELALILEGHELSSVKRRKRWRREPTVA